MVPGGEDPLLEAAETTPVSTGMTISVAELRLR